MAAGPRLQFAMNMRQTKEAASFRVAERVFHKAPSDLKALLHVKHRAEFAGGRFEMEHAQPVAGLLVIDGAQMRSCFKHLFGKRVVLFKHSASIKADKLLADRGADFHFRIFLHLFIAGLEFTHTKINGIAYQQVHAHGTALGVISLYGSQIKYACLRQKFIEWLEMELLSPCNSSSRLKRSYSGVIFSFLMAVPPEMKML